MRRAQPRWTWRLIPAWGRHALLADAGRTPWREISAMDVAEKFATEMNIARFADQLYHERDRQRQHWLRRLLVEEEDKLAQRWGQLELAEQYIAESSVRIDRQKALIARIAAAGQDVTDAATLLESFVAVRNTFEQICVRIRKGWIGPGFDSDFP